MPERFLGRSLGKFRVDALIGTGGFAWVYKAYDPELEVPVALKVLKPQFAGDEQFEQRFRREAAIAARLRHPNIVKIFAVGKDAEAVYFAMDFLPQGLPDRLEVISRLPDAVLIRIGIDVASAIGFAHRESVIHRDIKVDNILFDEHGNAIVADFGIARAVSNYVQETGTNMVVGTPQYFSPEQARGLPLDGRSDIYSLGVTLYRAATGRLPFTGDDWYEIARQHVEERPVRARKHNPALSRDLEHVIMRCLEKNADARYQTGEALCQALAALSFERADTIAMRGTPAPAGPNVTPVAADRRATGVWGKLWALPGLRRVPAVLHASPLGRLSPLTRRGRRWRLAGGSAAILAAVLVGVYATLRAGAPSGAGPNPALPAGGNAPLSTAAMAAPTSANGAPLAPVGAASPEAPAGGSSPTNARPVAATVASGHTSSGVTRADPATPKSSTGSASAQRGHASAGTVRGVGTVRLDAKPAGAAYILQSLDGSHIAKGLTPLAAPLTLPAGKYSVLISARYCASYRDTLRIMPNRPAAAIHIRLVCAQ